MKSAQEAGLGASEARPARARHLSLGTGRSGGPGAALRTSLAATRRKSASASAGRVLPAPPSERGAGPGLGPRPLGPALDPPGVRGPRPDSRASANLSTASHTAAPRSRSPQLFRRGGARRHHVTPRPPGPGHMGGTAAASVTVLAAGGEPSSPPPPADGAEIRCQLLVSPPPPPPSAVPGWARPSWSGSGPPPVPCEVCRRHRLRCSRPCEAPPPPESLALGSLSPPPGGLECAPGEGAGPAQPRRRREMVRA